MIGAELLCLCCAEAASVFNDQNDHLLLSESQCTNGGRGEKKRVQGDWVREKERACLNE